MNRILLALSILHLSLPIPAADIDFSAVASVRVGTNEVASISIGGTVVWQRPAPAPSEVVLFHQSFDGLSEGSAGAVVLAIPRTDGGTGAWYRYRARPVLGSSLGPSIPDQDNHFANMQARSASGNGARWVASPAVSGHIGTLSLRIRARSTGNSPVLCAFMLPASGTEDASSSGWPLGYVSGGAWPSGAVVLADSIVAGSTAWQDVSIGVNRDITSPHRLFIGRMFADSGQTADIDDIRLTGIPTPAEEPGIYITGDGFSGDIYGTHVELDGTVRFNLEPTQNGMGWDFWLREGQTPPSNPGDMQGLSIADPGTGGNLVMVWSDSSEWAQISGIDTDAPTIAPFGDYTGTISVRKVPAP